MPLHAWGNTIYGEKSSPLTPHHLYCQSGLWRLLLCCELGLTFFIDTILLTHTHACKRAPVRLHAHIHTLIVSQRKTNNQVRPHKMKSAFAPMHSQWSKMGNNLNTHAEAGRQIHWQTTSPYLSCGSCREDPSTIYLASRTKNNILSQ